MKSEILTMCTMWKKCKHLEDVANSGLEMYQNRKAEGGIKFMDSKKIKVWAHRGASGYAPENTMDAFQKAIEMKADGIELDVHLTKDGEVVVIHDEVLDRVSDGTGRVQDFTCNE